MKTSLRLPPLSPPEAAAVICTRRSALATVCSVVLGWVALAAGSTGLAADSKAAIRKVHTILSCNIRVPLEADAVEGNGWRQRRELCAEIIGKLDGDVVCLQECFGEQLDYLKVQLRRYESYGQSNPAPEFKPINAILFDRERYEMISGGGYWLSETPHVAGSKSWDSAVARSTNWVHLRERKTGRELRVWNAHLDHVGHVARREQARLLVEGIASQDASGVPQVLCGDMNAPADHPAIVNLREGGMIDTYEAMHGPNDPGNTFHGFLGSKWNELKHDGRPGRKIDWIFTRGEVRTHAAEIVRDGREGRWPSDHYFLSATIQLPE